MNTEIDRKLWKYLFPVEERKVLFEGQDGTAHSAPA